MNILNIKDLEIKELDSAEEYYNKSIRHSIIFIRCFYVIPIGILITELINKKGMKELLFTFLFMIFFFIMIEFLAYDTKKKKVKGLEEIKLFTSNTYSTIGYEIKYQTRRDNDGNKKTSKDVSIYLDNNIKSVVITNVKFKNVTKPVLDFKTGCLYVNEVL